MAMSLPDRPSMESIRKQAKALVRAVNAGETAALSLVRAHLSVPDPQVSLRDAQLVLAREYGFSGWADLQHEVLVRSGHGLEWAAHQAEQAIHEDDVSRLQSLLDEHPGLLTWHDTDGHSLLDVTSSYAMDNRDSDREERMSHLGCAELLIDAGAVVESSMWQLALGTGASDMLHLLARKAVLPDSLPVLAALGDTEAASGRRADDEQDLFDSLAIACRFGHVDVATMLLDRCIAADPELGQRIDRWKGRSATVKALASPWSIGGRYLGEPGHETVPLTPWQAVVMHEVQTTIDDDDLTALRRWLDAESWLGDEDWVAAQISIVERSAWRNRESHIAELWRRTPALLRIPDPPRSAAMQYAFEYGNDHLVPLLRRVWPVPDDLPHAAGLGDRSTVEHWFDAAGRPALGRLDRHYPNDDSRKRADLGWRLETVQHVLDVALAWACLNHHFDVAEYLLEHGADINTDWGTHEPASILHECVVQDDLEGAEFLLQHGIDQTLLDRRFRGTPLGWARYTTGNPAMIELLGGDVQVTTADF